MDLGPITAELDKPKPSRDAIIEELDCLTDPLRAGFPTTEIVNDLFPLFTRLISFSQWHIQQYALSCTKYIFDNSTLSRDAKADVLHSNLPFLAQLAILFSDAKREVREMAAQCLQHLALAVGPSILDSDYGLSAAIFSPALTAAALEGQQMALGRLATAFRIVSPDALDRVLAPMLDSATLNSVTNPTDNGYVFWYSTRAIHLLIGASLDGTLGRHLPAFAASHTYVHHHLFDKVIPVALARLRHDYANVRRAAASVVGEIFGGLEDNHEQFIESLLPESGGRWVGREGRLRAIYCCLQTGKQLSGEFVQRLCDTLSSFTRDEAVSDPTPLNQKGSANGMAGRALVQVLLKHDTSLFARYVCPNVQFLLDAPVAAFIDAGIWCVSELKEIGGFELTDLFCRAFKNLGHAAMPIRDIARRTLPVAELLEGHFDQLVKTTAGYATSSDPEVRESVCKSLQIAARSHPLPPEIAEVAQALSADEAEGVRAAALDLYRTMLDEQIVGRVPDLVRAIVVNDGEDGVAALKLMKSGVLRHRDVVAERLYRFAPVLAFHSIASLNPAVVTAAQLLLVAIAGAGTEVDEALGEQFAGIDIDSASVEDFDELMEAADGNGNAAATMLQCVVSRFCDDLGVESIEELLAEEEATAAELLAEVENAPKNVKKVAALLAKAGELEADVVGRVLQATIDLLADESVELEEKKPILLGLDGLRRVTELPLPDATPISTTHLQEGFAKGL